MSHFSTTGTFPHRLRCGGGALECHRVAPPALIRQADGVANAGIVNSVAYQLGAKSRPDRRPVPTMSPGIPKECPHDLRPGVTVCLHCRRAEMDVSRAKVARVGVRAGAAGLVIAITVAFVVSGSDALRDSGDLQTGNPPSLETASLVGADSPQDSLVSAAPNPVRGSALLMAAEPPVPPAIKSTPRPLAPLVAPGRTEVGDGLYIERAGETVTVHFDTPTTRTRRRDKFESVVRRTLPEVYGSAAEAILSSIPEGTLVDPTIMVTDIAERGRGVRLDSGDGWKFSLWPETRPGEDGPLVVSYRVAVTQ